MELTISETSVLITFKTKQETDAFISSMPSLKDLVDNSSNERLLPVKAFVDKVSEVPKKEFFKKLMEIAERCN